MEFLFFLRIFFVFQLGAAFLAICCILELKSVFCMHFGARISHLRGFWLLAFGFWLLASGFWLLASGFWLLASGFWLLAFGFWLLAFGFWLLAFITRLLAFITRLLAFIMRLHHAASSRGFITRLHAASSRGFTRLHAASRGFTWLLVSLGFGFGRSLHLALGVC